MQRMRMIPLAGLLAGLALGACAPVAGDIDYSERYGSATAANTNAQIAYGDKGALIRSLSEDFRANAQDTVNFAFNRSAIDRSAQRALNAQVAWLKANEAAKMMVVGHTDLVGSERYNDRLGLRRARAVVRYMVRRGIARNRLLAVESRGERDPLVQTEQRERRNRRSVTVVAGLGRFYVGTGLDGIYAARVYNNYQAGAFGVSEAESSGIN